MHRAFQNFLMNTCIYTNIRLFYVLDRCLILSASSSLTRSLISSKPRSIASPLPRPVLIRRSVMDAVTSAVRALHLRLKARIALWRGGLSRGQAPLRYSVPRRSQPGVFLLSHGLLTSLQVPHAPSDCSFRQVRPKGTIRQHRP